MRLMSIYGLLVSGLVAGATNAAPLDCNRRLEVLFVSSGAQSERDVPLRRSLRIDLDTSGNFVLRCFTLGTTQGTANLRWRNPASCPSGAPSVRVRWQNDGSILIECSPVAGQPGQDNQGDTDAE